MKKIFIILILTIMAILPVIAKEGFAAGIEAGQPSGITVTYGINEKWDGYVTAAVGFGNASYIDAVIGGQYKVTSFTIGKANFDVNAGAQVGTVAYLGNTSGVLLTIRGTGSVSYDWTWDNVGDFTAYIRTGLGVGFGIHGDATKAGFNWAAALGCVYHF